MQLHPSSRWIPTHQRHRSGRAGRWRDGSSIHCSNYRGKSRKLCLGCGCIQRRQTCLGGKRGIRRQESISAACCTPQSPSLASLSPSRLHGYAATSSSLSGRVTMATASPVSLSHLVYQCWCPSDPPLPPGLPGATLLTWGTAGAADLMLRLVVFLLLVPASLVFYAIRGHLPGGGGDREQGRVSSVGRRAGEKFAQALFLTWPIPPSPSLTSGGWAAITIPQSPSRSGPQTRPQGEAPGRRMAAFRVG